MLLDRGHGKPTTAVAGDKATAPLAIDFRWADAVPEQQPNDGLAKTPAEQLVHRTVACAVEEDAGAVADMVTCGNA
jgi:hypothetical protein